MAEIVAERELTLIAPDGSKKKVYARVLRPRQLKSGDFVCSFDVAGLRRSTVGQDAHGVDSLQALELALKSLSSFLHRTPEWRAGRLRFGNSSDLGLQTVLAESWEAYVEGRAQFIT